MIVSPSAFKPVLSAPLISAVIVTDCPRKIDDVPFLLFSVKVIIESAWAKQNELNSLGLYFESRDTW